MGDDDKKPPVQEPPAKEEKPKEVPAPGPSVPPAIVIPPS